MHFLPLVITIRNISNNFQRFPSTDKTVPAFENHRLSLHPQWAIPPISGAGLISCWWFSTITWEGTPWVIVYLSIFLRRLASWHPRNKPQYSELRGILPWWKSVSSVPDQPYILVGASYPVVVGRNSTLFLGKPWLEDGTEHAPVILSVSPCQTHDFLSDFNFSFLRRHRACAMYNILFLLRLPRTIFFIGANRFIY